MKTIDLPKIQQIVKQFAEERDWDKFHSVKNLSMALTVESSELMEIFQWLTEDESNRAHLDPKLKTKIEDEVADVFIYLLRIVGKTDMDLEQAILNKMQKNIEKYPVDKARGNSKKYTDL
ncbi:nucleotide pyrophosphohydrolase [Peredibacter starrii]|uniref:Nucleotide pyrophosphohydrolase n=1 Tax=Peredibacter starrii TaxID=28202 RepID=A0AAX4HUI6_9BACT|nr:nucleotide pyrophosphohydrolase [Peredibacter starrii]WPU66881.1 nucleotide pyrophosphohydrolase [Peredibacter starrii]